MELREILKTRLGDWYNELGEEGVISTLSTPINFLSERRKQVHVEPKGDDVLKAYKLTQFKDLKAVIVGLDPYNTKGVATGVAFSSGIDFYTPPSLKYIHKAIEEDVYGGFKIDTSNNLDYLAKQGVLMLNTALTTELGQSGIHLDIWRDFVSLTIKTISDKKLNVPFMLLGAEARKFSKLINSNHLVLEASHPASAAYTNKIWDCNKVFSKCSNYLEKHGNSRIEW